MKVNTMPETILALDYGSKRIGVARANLETKFPSALSTIEVDGEELYKIQELVEADSIKTIVVGWPRNLEGEETKQTKSVAKFIEKLKELGCTIVKQDEALTSVEAEVKLNESMRKYTKSDVDGQAAVIILQDYLMEKNK